MADSKQRATISGGSIVLIGVAAFAISCIGATFSVTGLAKLFSGASLSVMLMAGALEFGKVVAAGFLHRYWGRLQWALRIYLSFIVVILMSITSLGIFGYLSHAYEKSSQGLNAVKIRIETLKTEERKVQEEIARIQKNLDEIPQSRITKKLQTEKEFEPEIERLKKRSFEINVSLQQASIEQSGYQTEVGPLVYVAEAFNVDMSKVAHWFILLFVMIFDPMAICMVFATSWALKTRTAEKEAAAEAAKQEAKLAGASGATETTAATTAATTEANSPTTTLKAVEGKRVS